MLLAVTGVSLYLLLPSLAAVFSSWRSLSHLNWYWTGFTLLSEAASFVCLWEFDRISLDVSSWFTVASAQLTGNSVGRIVPGGAATATAVAVGMLRRAGVDLGRAAAALTASTLMQIATRLTLPLFALPAIIGSAPISHSLVTSAYLGLLALLLLDVAGILAFASDRPLLLAGRGLQWALNETAIGGKRLLERGAR